MITRSRMKLVRAGPVSNPAVYRWLFVCTSRKGESKGQHIGRMWSAHRRSVFRRSIPGNSIDRRQSATLPPPRAPRRNDLHRLPSRLIGRYAGHQGVFAIDRTVANRSHTARGATYTYG